MNTLIAVIRRIPFAVAVASLTLGGCSTGTSTPLPVQPNRTTAEIRIAIPPNPPAAGAARTPSYISPSTQSIGIAIAPVPTCSGCSSAVSVNASLTPTSPNCSTSAGTTQCTIPLALKPGAYAATITTYGGPLVSGMPSGNTLSYDGALPLTITANVDNEIPLTLSGMPATISVSPVAGGSTAFYQFHNNTFRFPGVGATSKLAVNVKDALGNTIIGPGSPVVTAQVTSGGAGFSASVSGNVVTVTNPSTGSRRVDTLKIGLSSNACTQSYAACSATPISLQMEQLIAILDQSAAMLAVITPNGAVVGTAPTGMLPQAATFNSKGDLLVVNGGANSLSHYSPPYTTASSTVLGLSGADAVAVDGDDNAYVAENGNVALIAPPYNALSTTTSITGQGVSIALDPVTNGRFFVGTAGSVQRFDGMGLAAAATVAVSQPSSITFDSASNLFITDPSSNHILEVDRNLSLITTINGSINPTYAAIDANGNLAVSTQLTHEIDIYQPPYVTTSLTYTLTGPTQLAYDLDGTLFVCDWSAAKLIFFANGSQTVLGTPLGDPKYMAIWP